MTEETLKEGDVVVLKSGGPDMTYASEDAQGRAICVWFDSNNGHQEKPFYKAAIEKKKTQRGY
jgi:uncharacterized protein YodC (DUF2158 family)